MADTNPDLPVKDMRFANGLVGARIRNTLQRNGVHTLRQLIACSEEELLELRGFGTICLAELTIKLKRMGLALRKDPQW